MWSYMDQTAGVWSKSNQEGVERVLKEDGMYAFMMESTVVDYVVERQCELTQVGGLLDNKGYGIGLPPSKIYNNKMLLFTAQFKSLSAFCIYKQLPAARFPRKSPSLHQNIISNTDLRFTEICVWWILSSSLKFTNTYHEKYMDLSRNRSPTVCLSQKEELKE